MKGFHCHIYKHRGQSQDGISAFSSKIDEVTLIPNKYFPRIPQEYEATKITPLCEQDEAKRGPRRGADHH